jgi:hypothetical protein
MSDTFREFKGKKYPDKSKKNKRNHKKYFGETSGTHSVHAGDMIPIVDVDFVKYGWPCHLYPKHIVKAKKKGYE